MKTYSVCFEHSSGGDSKLPPKDRGFFDFFSIEVEAESEEEAFRLAWDKLADMVSAEHPEWVHAAWQDLTPVLA